MATTAAAALDPTFVKALRLLQSKSKDSTIQLRATLDEAISVRRGYGTPRNSRSPTGSKDTSRSVSIERGDQDRKEIDKEKRKDLDRLKADLNQLEPKRPRLDSPTAPMSNNSDSADSPLGSESSQGEFGELQMNIELDCTCIVCKSFNQESSNKLMECSTCQNLFHQECHDPPVSNTEASDPRLIWNCSRCTRRNPPPSSSSGSSRSTSVEKTSTGGGSTSGTKQEKSSSSKPHSSSSSSSRHHSSSSSSHKSSKRHKPSPNKVSSKHRTSHSSSSLIGSTSSSSSGSHLTDAQKRLKQMKKQAAAASLSKKKNK